MFTHIRTSKENKGVVTQLTNKLTLGAENVIARIALAYSLAQVEKLSLEDIRNSGGKEYSKSVLFGENFDVYIGMICSRYDLYRTDKDIAKLVKLHLDDGLESISKKLESNTGQSGFEIIVSVIN